MKHEWVYRDEDKDYRKCKNCLIEEWYVDEDEGWVWIASDDFMDCTISCEDD